MLGKKIKTFAAETALISIIFCTVLICTDAGIARAAKYDNISSISIKLTDSVARNALKKNTEYTFAYNCRTVSGSSKNTTSYIYYELTTMKGCKVDASKAVLSAADGSFKASSCGLYKVTVYAFKNKSLYKKWSSDKDSSSGLVLASSSMLVTVTRSNYLRATKKIYGFKITVPASYEFSNKNFDSGAFSFTLKGKANDAKKTESSITVSVTPVDEVPDFAVFRKAVKSTYTKSFIHSTLETFYTGGNLSVTDLSFSVKKSKTDILKMTYRVKVTDAQTSDEDGIPVYLGDISYRNTVYMYYNGLYYITVNCLDAYESIQPNISEAAFDLIDNFYCYSN